MLIGGTPDKAIGTLKARPTNRGRLGATKELMPGFPTGLSRHPGSEEHGAPVEGERAQQCCAPTNGEKDGGINPPLQEGTAGKMPAVQNRRSGRGKPRPYVG